MHGREGRHGRAGPRRKRPARRHRGAPRSGGEHALRLPGSASFRGSPLEDVASVRLGLRRLGAPQRLEEVPHRSRTRLARLVEDALLCAARRPLQDPAAGRRLRSGKRFGRKGTHPRRQAHFGDQGRAGPYASPFRLRRDRQDLFEAGSASRRAPQSASRHAPLRLRPRGRGAAHGVARPKPHERKGASRHARDDPLAHRRSAGSRDASRPLFRRREAPRLRPDGSGSGRGEGGFRHSLSGRDRDRQEGARHGLSRTLGLPRHDARKPLGRRKALGKKRSAEPFTRASTNSAFRVSSPPTRERSRRFCSRPTNWVTPSTTG